jgi:hypothetical protein
LQLLLGEPFTCSRSSNHQTINTLIGSTSRERKPLSTPNTTCARPLRRSVRR